MAFTHFKVIRVVSRRNFDGTRTELDIYIIIGNDFHFSVYQGNEYLLTDILFHSFIIRIYGNSRITHNSFGTSRGNHDIVVFTYDGILYVPQMACFVLVIYFYITQSRMAMRAPVRNAMTLVNKTLFIQSHEYFTNGTGTNIVHGKPFPRPVTR